MELSELPDLAVLKVLDFFSNEEKIKRLMFVCKRWHSLVQADLQQLAIYDRRSPYRIFWDALAEREVDHKYVVRSKRFTEKFTIRFANLKRLFLYEVTSCRLFLSSLNNGSLDQLVELRITWWSRGEGCLDPSLVSRLKSEKINLPSLRKLCSNCEHFHPSDLSSPNLESISVPHWKEVNFPEKVKFIWCQIFETNQIFSNLERLVCRRINGVLPLEAMPKLKRVELLPNEASDFEMIKNLRKQKKRLRRPDLLIWVSAFKENFTANLIECFWRRFQYSPPPVFDSLLDPLDHVDYNEPLCVFPWRFVICKQHFFEKYPNLEEIPENFFNIFINIQELSISGVQVDGENIIQFIKKAKSIWNLNISDNRFNENFFRELSRIQSIQVLYLTNVFPPSADSFDIGFMFNLQNIGLMEIRENLTRFKMSAQLFIEFLRTMSHEDWTIVVIECVQKFFWINLLSSIFNYDGLENDEADGLDFDSLDALISYAEDIARSEKSIFYLDSNLDENF